MAFVSLFQSTGFVGILMLVCGVVGIVMIVRRIADLRMERIAPPDLLRQVERAAAAHDLDSLSASASASRSCVARLLTAGLQLRAHGVDEMLAHLERTAAGEALRLGNRIANLSRLAVCALLLGMFGTTTGIISTLLVIKSIKAPTANDFAIGICESLVSIAFGSLVALVSFIAFYCLDHRLTRRTLDATASARDLLIAATKADGA